MNNACNPLTWMTRSTSAFPRAHGKGVTVITRWYERLVNIFPVRGFIRTLIPLFAHVEMLAMCHFSWRRTKSMMNSGLPSKSKFEGKSLNKTETTKERKTTLLENICNSPKHQSPCKPKQLWECVTVGDRPRLRKCRKSGSVQETTTPTTRPTPSLAPTSPVKMCVCMKPRPGPQGDMSPYNGEKTSSNFSEITPSLFLGPFAPLYFTLDYDRVEKGNALQMRLRWCIPGLLASFLSRLCSFLFYFQTILFNYN